MALIERFKNLASKIQQIKSLISTSVGEETPDILNLNMILNIDLRGKESYNLILSPSESRFEKGKSPFAIMTITSNEDVWNKVFDGDITLFGAYTSGKIKVNKYRSNRFNLFILSGLISFLLNMKIKL